MRHATLAAALLLATAGTLGCHIDTDQHGDADNVKIATPFGGMSIKTDTGDVLAGIGLPLYPGATSVKKEKEDGKHDSGSADVNMSFGSFQLKVKAAEYRTGDTPGLVLAFYKKALNRYGTVIQCAGKRPVGSPAITAEGLTCDDNDRGTSSLHATGKGIQINKPETDQDAKMQLKAGSRKRQHIVDIDPEGAGTKFSLIALDLPLDIHLGDKLGDDKDSDKDDKQ